MINQLGTADRLSWSRYAALIGLAFSMAFVGCGGESKATVKGQVKYKGQPVKGGTITFSPVTKGLRAASATVGEDGAFTLGTAGAADGALIGKYSILYSPPVSETPPDKLHYPTYVPPVSPYVGLVAKQGEIEVTPGSNDINVELVEKKGK